jgi:hypothetical protein
MTTRNTPIKKPSKPKRTRLIRSSHDWLLDLMNNIVPPKMVGYLVINKYYNELAIYHKNAPNV